MAVILASYSDLQRGTFTARQALDAGHSVDEIRSLLRSGRWRRLRRGVYVESRRYAEVAEDPRELHLLHCAALSLALQRRLLLSHWSAARIHRFRFLMPPPPEVWATDPSEARGGRGYRISGATLPPEHVTIGDGFDLTSGARTVCDLARTVSFRQGVVIADSALRSGAATADGLREVALYCSHFEGIGRASRVCSFADGRAESVLESVSRVDLVRLGLPVPELQLDVYDHEGFVARPDMLWLDVGVVGEADGKVKYADPYASVTPEEVLWAEKRRMARLEKAGLAVVRWTSDELRRTPQHIVDRFWQAARRERTTSTYRILSRGDGTPRAV